ncbi:hypothetical protein PoB_006539800 [Plakobranchus ocellatus]|uniref:Uncharacterized protein n=1 Tax=Plakobranchus ocellatus TaxID=259542 RepID=A0AAV4D3Y0_9GAST|nr:hypothetical protein PoB_006539800 [Plakobranchus ocellatus]
MQQFSFAMRQINALQSTKASGGVLKQPPLRSAGLAFFSEDIFHSLYEEYDFHQEQDGTNRKEDHIPRQSTPSLDSTITFGVTVAVGEYNMGSSGSHLFFQAVGCALTSATICLSQRRDKIRIRKAEAAHEAPAQRRCELKKQAQQRAQQDATRAESSPSYVPAGF